MNFSVKWLGITLAGLFFIFSCAPFTGSQTTANRSLIPADGNERQMLNQGMEALQSARYPEARQFFIEAYKLNPRNPKTLFYLGLTMEILGKPILAFQIYSRFVTFSTEEYFPRLMKGRYHWLARDILKKEYQEAARNPRVNQKESIPNRVVVLPFFVQDSNGIWQGLGRGITDLITRDLEQINRLHVVSGLEQQALYQALSLSENSPASRSVVGRVQRAVPGAMVIVGNVQNINGSRFVLRASVLKPNTKVFLVEKVEGDFSELFDLQKQLVFRLLKQLDVRLTIQEREHLRFIPTSMVEAFRLYGIGLTAEDNLNYATAIEYYNQAVALDNQFSIARDRLQYVKIMNIISGSPHDILPRLATTSLSMRFGIPSGSHNFELE